MKQILDLHIHSKYSRACSKELELPKIAHACEIKGIDICSTADFTHPGWFSHIKEKLAEDKEGIYRLKSEEPNLSRSKWRDPVWTAEKSEKNLNFKNSKTKFIIGTEIASVKKHKDKTRRLHLLVFAPNIEVAEKFNKKLDDRGINLKSDGRPIIGMTARDILELMLGVDERMVMIPAHAWTPWFGVFGSKGGYDNLLDCFEDLTSHIFAIETGLSSDPAMNWRLSALDNISLVSNSDAHSLPKLGREANVINFKNEAGITYSEIMRILKEKKKKEFLYTIEFYPEEGRYYLDGHRDCKFVCSPERTKKLRGICPKCNKKLVVGVLNRVIQLSDRGISETTRVNQIPYKSLVPLDTILAGVFGCGVNTKKVKLHYNNLLENFDNEFSILLDEDVNKIKKVAGNKIAVAIKKAREGDIFIESGYDGQFGVVKILK